MIITTLLVVGLAFFLILETLARGQKKESAGIDAKDFPALAREMTSAARRVKERSTSPRNADPTAW